MSDTMSDQFHVVLRLAVWHNHDVLQFSVFFFQAEDGIRDYKVTGVQTCALPISCSTPRPGCCCPMPTSACGLRAAAPAPWTTALRAGPWTMASRLARARTRSRPHRPAMCRWPHPCARSEEHTSELQSPCNLVCRLLLEKKKY